MKNDYNTRKTIKISGKNDFMIKAAELRITNYVEYNGEYKTVAELFNSSSSDKWDPIPLSTEILEAAGFEIKIHATGISYVEINDYLWLLIIRDENNQVHLTLASSEWMHDLQARVFYLHQLQNLYHSLTGEELYFNDKYFLQKQPKM